MVKRKKETRRDIINEIELLTEGAVVRKVGSKTFKSGIWIDRGYRKDDLSNIRSWIKKRLRGVV